MTTTTANQTRLSRISERAATLFSTDGYVRISTETPGKWEVRRPNGGLYLVYISPKGNDFCTCPSFKHDETCKHVQACRLEDAREMAQCAEFEEMEFGRFAMESDAAEHMIAA